MTTPDPDALLARQPERSRPFSIPDVLSDRLDTLCAILNGADGKVGTIYRKDLVAALSAFAPEELEDLEKLITDYRTLKVRDALVGAAKNATVIQLRPVRPGRRLA